MSDTEVRAALADLRKLQLRQEIEAELLGPTDTWLDRIKEERKRYLSNPTQPMVMWVTAEEMARLNRITELRKQWAVEDDEEWLVSDTEPRIFGYPVRVK